MGLRLIEGGTLENTKVKVSEVSLKYLDCRRHIPELTQSRDIP